MKKLKLGQPVGQHAPPRHMLEAHGMDEQSSVCLGPGEASQLTARRQASWARSSPFLLRTGKLFKASEEVQRVDSHVPGEEHVEAAEPEQLAAVAGHGFLGLGHFFAGEHEEDIPGLKQSKGQVQEGDILA